MLKIDLHLHTVASRHAQSTAGEYASQAKKLGMATIGFADHGPANESTLGDDWYFIILNRLPKEIEGVRILKGIEANIIDQEGNIDVTDRMHEELDFVAAGFHKRAGYEDLGFEENTQTMINVINSGKVKILTHPFLTTSFQFDAEKIAEEACRKNVLLEANISWIKQNLEDSLLNLQKIAAVVKKHGKKMIVGSDSHNVWELGVDLPLKKVQKKIGLTDEMIINNYPKELYKFLGVKE